MQSQISTILTVAAFLAAGFILIYGATQYSKLKKAVEKLTLSLNEMLHTLRAIPDPQTFARDFDEIDQPFRALPITGPVWNEFRRTLFRRDDGGEVSASQPPSAYFNDHLPYRAKVDLRSFDSIPNQLVGLGLLFTFIGLLASLLVASYGITGEFEEVKATLVQLLWASGFKFVTSIAAIFASLNFVARKNSLLAELSRTIEKTDVQLERLTVAVTTEALTEASRGELERQTVLLKRGSDDLASEIARQLDLTLRANLGREIAPVATEINAMAGRISQINEAAMRYMIKEFTEKLGGQAREHDERLAMLLDRVSRTMEEVPGRIEQASLSFSTSVASAAAGIDDTLKGSGAALASLLEDVTRNIGASASAFQSVVEHLGRATDRLDQAEASVVERAERAETAVRAAIDQLAVVLQRTDAASTALAPLAKLAGTLEHLATLLASSTAGMNEFVDRSQNILQESRRAGDALAKSAADFSVGVRELDSSLDSVLGQIGSGMDAFKGKVDHVVEAMDDHLGSAVDTLSDVVARMIPPANDPGRPRPRAKATRRKDAAE